MDVSSLEQIATGLLNRLDYAWTFILFLTRYFVFLIFVPGLGGGMAGAALRYPAALMLAVASVSAGSIVEVPADMVEMMAQVFSEVMLGSVVALVPLLIVAGAQTAGHLATGTMGLNGAQMFDLSTATPLSDLARIYSDLSIVIFLLIGGHYVAIAELAGLSQSLKPGIFILSDAGLGALLEQSARIFTIGCLIAAPVVVALLLTNFVLGVISKAIPTVNVFVISFPITIGVGLAISILALPEVAQFLEREFNRLPEVISVIIQP